MRVDLNLATRPLVNRTPHFLLLLVLGVAAVALTAWNGVLLWSTRSEAREVSAERSRLEAQRIAVSERADDLRKRLRQVDQDELGERVAAANEVLGQRALSWSLLLRRLQETLPWKVKMRSIRTRVSEESVDLSLEIATPEQDFYLQFIDDLEASACFSGVYPKSEGKDEDGTVWEIPLELEYDPWCGEKRPESSEPRRRGRRSRRG
ncbi:MAG: hypothetical protein AAF533_26765 [Acidobacteriota bacterium]